MSSGDNVVSSEEKTPEQIEEEKLRAKYPNLVTKGPSILQKRLNRNVKYFDSGDYNMAKARCNNPQKSGALTANPLTSSASPVLPVEVMAAQQTGDTIPTPENVPAVRKKAAELQQELQNQTHLSAPGAVNATGHPNMPLPGSPTKPAAEPFSTATAPDH
ncbi:unnamed protein product [Mesocestoides corti]|uniref:mRNA stability protein n=1 Tax=Mesocestoides corti TaxID=53468 RepID=A0A0R3U2V1_MESCO|nr:unnamed protein product [Mesocestoides corti]